MNIHEYQAKAVLRAFGVPIASGFPAFTPDEASQTITGKYRQLHPEDNNERQTIHEHVSVALNGVGAQTGKTPRAVSKLTSGAKAHSKTGVSGTTEVVPFPSTSPNIGPSTSHPGNAASSGGQNR